MAIVFRLPAAQVVDANGNPLSGAKLYFYERGTTTPKNVFSDEGLTTPVSQPAVANSAGQWAQIYMSADRYRVQLYTSADVLVADYDNFDPGQPLSLVGGGALPLSLGGTGVTSLSALQSLLGLGAAATWTDVASAATVDLNAAPSSNVRITGTTTVTSFGTAASGTTRQIRFAAVLTLTHNATSLILPGAANITTAADDTAVAVSLGSGNWIVVDYQRANGRPVANIIDYQAFTTVGAGTWTKPAGATADDLVLIMAWGAGGGGGANGGGGGAAGGGGGACVWLLTTAGRWSATESISVGTGGASSTSVGNGGAGGNSSFSSFTAFGGGGGVGGATPNVGGGGGWQTAGSGGTAGTGYASGQAFAGGGTGITAQGSIFGGASGSSPGSAAVNSVFGGGGGGASATTTAGSFSVALGTQGGTGGTNGTTGGTACGGGGGTATGGAGGRGEVRVWTIRKTSA